MDARGRQTGGGQSKEVQLEPTLAKAHDHIQSDGSGHVSFPPTPNPDAGEVAAPDVNDPVQDKDRAETLADLKRTVAEQAQVANETLTAYQAKHQLAIQKHVEAEKMNSEIAAAVGKAQTNLDHIPSSFESVKQNTEIAKQLLQAIDTSLTTLAALSGEVDDAVGNIEKMPDTDGHLKWAIDGSKQAKTNYEGVETETTNLRKGVADKIALADTAIAQKTDAIDKAQKALEIFKKLAQTGEGESLSLKQYADSIHFNVVLLKHNQTIMEGFNTAVSKLVKIEDAAAWQQTNDAEYIRLSDQGNSLKD